MTNEKPKNILTISLIDNDIYNIGTRMHQYLIVGEEKALLIDSGMGFGRIKPLIENVTKLPVILINTHGHPDHAGGNAEFDPAFMCPADFDVYEKMATKEFRIDDMSAEENRKVLEEQLLPTGPRPIPIGDGEVIDLGGRTVRIIYTPGHTHGSICIIDERTGYMFTGDNANGGKVSLHEWNASPLSVFADSLRRMKAENPKRLYTGHDKTYNPPEYLDTIIKCVEEILSGAPGEPGNVRGYDCLIYRNHGTSISYTADKIR